MKKITLFFIAISFAINSFSQTTTLSQSVDPATIDTGGVACWDSSSGEYRENSFARTYNLNSFGITGAWNISAVEFGQGSASDGKVVHINIYTSDTEDLTTATLTLVSTTDATLSSANDMTLISTPISANITANSIVVVEVNAPDSGTDTDQQFFPGFNISGENSTSWIKADSCGITNWTDVNTIGVSQQNYVINIVGMDATANTNEILANAISIFPNPVKDVINVNIPSEYLVKSVTIFDVLGKNSNIKLTNGTMDVSKLSSGIYLLNIKTDSGEITKKITIQ